MLVAKTSRRATNFTICNQLTGCYVHHPVLVAKMTSWATNFTICNQPTEWSKWTNNGAGFISVLWFATLFFGMDLTVASQWVWSDHHSLPKSRVCIGNLLLFISMHILHFTGSFGFRVETLRCLPWKSQQGQSHVAEACLQVGATQWQQCSLGTSSTGPHHKAVSLRRGSSTCPLS